MAIDRRVQGDRTLRRLGRARCRKRVAGGLAVLLATFAAPAAGAFRDLVDCRMAVEEVYWRHRIWPESNPGPKPRLAEVLPREVVEVRMDDALRQATTLAEGWNVRIDGPALQRELERMARNTKDPAMLRELFAAAGDGERAALCLALPELVKSRLAALYDEDPEIHRPLREQAEAALASVSQLEALADLGAEVHETVVVRAEDGDAVAARDAGAGLELDGEEWSRLIASLARSFAGPSGPSGSDMSPAMLGPVERASALPIGRRSQLLETPDGFAVREVREASDERLTVAIATWRKVPFDSWWRERRSGVERAEIAAGRVTLPRVPESGCNDDTWAPTAVDLLPGARFGHAAAWTGSEMLVWGGYDGVSLDSDGGRYSPATDSWDRISTAGSPSARWLASVAWTGTQMIVWGGASTGGGNPLATGARYTPQTDAWAPISSTGVPPARYENVTAWTGTQMIVWGGVGVNWTVLEDGAVYTPATNSWQPMTTVNRPTPRFRSSAVWTGNGMIVWGGEAGGGVFVNTGKRYLPGAPGADSWVDMNGTEAPSPRSLHTAIWAGSPVSKMVVFGGQDAPTSAFADGGLYDPALDTWQPMATSGAPPARYWHSAVWTGTEMVVWGGTPGGGVGLSSGGRYSPATNTWSGATSSSGSPPGGYLNTAVWTGTEMIVWGGRDSGRARDSGGRYDPVLDQWTPTRESRTPSARAEFASAWTGSELIVWGGFADELGGLSSNGAEYRPATDTWSPVSGEHPLVPAAYCTGVWSGTEFLVWGGADGAGQGLRNGGRYSPSLDAWEVIPDLGAPSPRALHTAVWSGTEMIIWAGAGLSGLGFNDGGAFSPSGGTWRDLPASPVSGRTEHTAVWTGTEMLIWGGRQAAGLLQTGARYRRATDSWSEMSTTNAPEARSLHSAVWAGAEMIVWGGFAGSPLETGGRYRPDLDAWTPVASADAPSGRFDHAAVWTGAEMIVWGGQQGANYTDSGGRYRPGHDDWVPTSIQSGTPTGRAIMAAVWTGREALFWGGMTNSALFNSGGRYCTSPIFADGFEQWGGDTSAWSAAVAGALGRALPVPWSAPSSSGSPVANHLVANGEFDDGVTGWEKYHSSGPDPEWLSGVDHDGCAESGSALFQNDTKTSPNYMRTCVLGIAGAAPYSLEGHLRFANFGNFPSANFTVEWLDSAEDCSGNILGSAWTQEITSETGNVWVESSNPTMDAPAGAHSAYVNLALHTISGLTQVEIDGVHLVPGHGFLFADGFDVASSCRWSGFTP